MSDDSLDPDEVLQEIHALAAAGEHPLAFRRMQRMLAEQTAPGSPAGEASAFAAVARAAEQGGDCEVARQALEAALQRVDWADLHLALGRLRVRLDEPAAARCAFDRALALNPRYRAAAVERALLDARAGHIAEAIGALRQLTGGTHVIHDPVFSQGLELLRAAAVDDAAPLVRHALADGDPALERLLAEARTNLQTGDHRAGLLALRRAVEKWPGYADLHALLGAHELRAGHLDDGLASLVHALELNPDFHAARLEMARGLEARGERDQALAQLAAILGCEPGHQAAAAFYEHLTSRHRGPAAA
jgi:tetratricopeptide (TPR) repeat protein